MEDLAHEAGRRRRERARLSVDISWGAILKSKAVLALFVLFQPSTPSPENPPPTIVMRVFLSRIIFNPRIFISTILNLIILNLIILTPTILILPLPSMLKRPGNSTRSRDSATFTQRQLHSKISLDNHGGRKRSNECTFSAESIGGWNWICEFRPQ